MAHDLSHERGFTKWQYYGKGDRQASCRGKRHFVKFSSTVGRQVCSRNMRKMVFSPQRTQVFVTYFAEIRRRKKYSYELHAALMGGREKKIEKKREFWKETYFYMEKISERCL